MLLKETIHKTNSLFHKTLENLKFFFFKGYQKLQLQKPISLNPFSCRKGNPHNLKTDRLYIDFYDEWQSTSTLHKAKKGRNESGNAVELQENMKKEESKHAKRTPPRNKQEVGVKEKKRTGNPQLRKCDVKNSSRRVTELVEKMKELEMLDRGDMEQELDVEEAIHYYSRLKSPVYLEIVDKFFMDMNSEIPIPEPSAGSRNSSKRRMGSMRL